MQERRETSALMRAIGTEDQAIALAEKVVGAADGAKAFAQQLLARMEEFQDRDGKIVDLMFKAQLESVRLVQTRKAAAAASA